MNSFSYTYLVQLNRSHIMGKTMRMSGGEHDKISALYIFLVTLKHYLALNLSLLVHVDHNVLRNIL